MTTATARKPRTKRDPAVPHDPGAEAAVLGSMIVDPGCIDDVVKVVERAGFFLREHQTIYDAVLAVRRQGGAGDGPDGLLVREELERRHQLDAVGGAEYLRQVVESVPSAANAMHYAEIVADRYARRQALEAARRDRKSVV